MNIPFENRKTLGFWKSLFETWKLACFNPNIFFTSVGETSDTTSAFYFFLIVEIFSILITGFVSFFFQLAVFSTTHHPLRMALLFVTTPLSIFIDFFLLIFLTIPIFFISVGITHIFLLLVKGAPRGFDTTLRTQAYATAPIVIPFAGALWALVLLYYALIKAHQVEWWRVLSAFLIESFVFLLLILSLILTVGLAIFHHMSH